MLIVPDKRALIVPEKHGLDGTPLIYRGASHRAIPHTIEGVNYLAGHGIKAPGPIQHYYKWAGSLTPFDHQRATADFFTLNARGFCFNGIGTGKTLSALWAIDYLKQTGKLRGPVLIISPLSTLVRVWGDAIWERLSHYDYGVIYGDRAQRERVMQSNYDFYIINPDGLKVFAKRTSPKIAKFKLDPGFAGLVDRCGLVIIDESTAFRNGRTDRWRAAQAVCERVERLWLMSGTPMPNAPTDIWAQARLVNKSMVPPYYGAFRELCMTKVNDHIWVPKKNWSSIVYPMIQPSIRFKREDCLDLPPITHQTLEVELSPEQKRVEKGLLKELSLELAQGRLTVANEGVKRIKLLQIYTGAVYADDRSIIKLDAKPRLAALEETLEAAEWKAIVFAPFRHTLGVIAERLEKHCRLGIVHGGVSPGKRNQIFADFQTRGKADVLLAHPGTMAHGLTLTAASVIIWYAPIDDFEIYDQACGRISRPGQTRNQLIAHIQGSKLERAMYQSLKGHESMQGILLRLLSE